MPKKRYKPATAKNATDRAKTAEVWIIFDTQTKKPWADPRNKLSNWFDVALSCDTLNSREK